MTAIRMSKPNGVKLVMKSVDASIKALTSGVTDKYKLFIICGNIADAAALVRNVPALTSINLGGLKNEPGKKQISKAISVDEQDVKLLKELHEQGVELEIRMVPGDPKQDPLQLI